jgi:hypothetical protein
MVRRINRAEQAAKNGAGDTSDLEGDDASEDYSMIEAGSRSVKKEKLSRRVVVEDIDR